MIRFPKRRADGSFDVNVRLKNVEASPSAIDAWLKAWSERNANWERLWSGPDPEVEHLRFSDEFFGPPTFHREQEREPTIRLRCRPDAKLWKDWMVKLTGEFCDAYPGAEVASVDSE